MCGFGGLAFSRHSPVFNASYKPFRPSKDPYYGLGRTTPSGSQLRLGCHQVAQSQQQRQTLRVLGQAPVAYLPVAEHPLHLQEGMLHPRSQSGAGSWPLPTPSASPPSTPDSQAPVADASPVASPPASPPPAPGFPPVCEPPTRRRTTPPFPRRATDGEPR